MKTAVNGRRSLVLVACCLALLSTFVIKSGVDVSARTPQEQTSRAGSPAERIADCGGEPCDAVLRGGLAFLDRSDGVCRRRTALR